MSTRNSEVRCIYCLASNSVPPGNAKCCCASCGRIFELAKASSAIASGSNVNSNRPEPPIVATAVHVNYRSTSNIAAPKIAAWPWPALASRSEEGRQKFFTVAFRNMLLISLPMFAFMLTLAIGYEVGIWGLLIIVPLAFVSALAMGLGQTWIVDNAYREGKNTGLIWWTPFYLQFFILTRWAICWRPMGMIAVGGAFYVSLLFYLMGDQLGTSVANNSNPTLANQTVPQQAKPFDSRLRSSPARRSRASGIGRENTVAENSYNGIQIQPAPAAPPTTAPVNETVWSYESLAPDTPVSNPRVEKPTQPAVSPVFEEDEGFREWSNLTGSYKVVAKIDVVDGDFVQLKTREGRKVRVEIAKLSQADRQFLEPILQSSPFEEVGGR